MYEPESEAPMSDVPEPHVHICVGFWTRACGPNRVEPCVCKCGAKHIAGHWVIDE